LIVFCSAFAGDERAPPGPLGAGPADLGFGAVQAQLDAVRGGVGDHIRQGAQPNPGQVGNGEPARGQQRPDLVDRAGDGGTVDPVQHRQRLVGQLGAQHHQGDQHPIREPQPLVWAGARRASTRMAAPPAQRALVRGGPRVGELGDHLAEVVPGDPGEARMAQSRAGPCWSRHPRMITYAAHAYPPQPPAINPPLTHKS